MTTGNANKDGTEPPPKPVLSSRFFRNSLISTLVALLACLSTHVIVLLGLTGAVAWLGTLEHALVFATLALAGLTAYAWFHHRRTCRRHGPD